MKNMSIILAIFCIFAGTIWAEEAVTGYETLDLEINVDIQNGQSQYSNDGASSSGGSEYTSTSTFGGIPGTSNQIAPQAMFYENSKPWDLFQVIEYDRLYHSLSELIHLMDRDGDILQTIKVPFKNPFNMGDVQIIKEIPPGVSYKLLSPLVLDTPDNGFDFEGIIRGISLLKLITNTNYVMITEENLLNAMNKSDSFSINSGGSQVIDQLAAILAAGKSKGEAESLVYKRHKLYMYAVALYPSETIVLVKNIIETEYDILSFQFGQMIEPDNPSLEKVAEKIFQNWNRRDILEVRGETSSPVNLEECTANTAIGIALWLNKLGISEEVLENKIGYSTGTLSEPLTNETAIGRIYVKGIPVGEGR